MHSFNLLPPAVIQRFERKRIVWAWSKVLLAGFIVTVLSVGWGHATANKTKLYTQQQSALAQYPQDVRRQHAELTSQLRALNTFESKQLELRSQFSPLPVLSMLHQLKEDLGGQLQATSVEFAELPATPGTPHSTPNGFVSLQLVTNGSTSCSDLTHRIRESQLFTDVKLSSPLELVDAAGEALRFTLRCEF